MPTKFKVGQLIRHRHHGEKGYDARPKGICMVLETVPGEDCGGYKLLLPEGSGFKEDEEASGVNPTWNVSFEVIA